MRILPVLLVAVALAYPAFAQASVDSVEPFRPRLSVNEEAVVCDPFLKVWTAVFDGPKDLEEDQIDLLDAYPGAWLWKFKDFYENPQTTKIDIDGDDELEVLYFDPNDVGWRYLGPSLFFFPSEKDFEAVVATRGPLTRWGFQQDMREPVPGANFQEIMELGSIRQFNLLQVGGHTYFTSNVSYPTETAPTAAALFRLEANGAARPYCIVELLPAKQTFAQYRDGSQVFAGLKDVYGEPTYQGTMGWTANPKDFAFSTILYRPWAMSVVGRRPVAFRNPPQDRAAEDVARELRYLDWGARDPQSWRDYIDVKEGRAPFIADMRRHYAQRFSKSDAEALALAEQAWRYLLDEIIYGRNDDGFNLVVILNDPAAKLSVTTDSTPSEIVRVAVEDWRRRAPERARQGSQWSQGSLLIARTLLIASVHTRQPIPSVRRQAKELMGFVDAIKNDVLLASLGHNGLTNFAIEELGADLDAETSGMAKTPLMYAAQLDRLNAVQLLIGRGANVNRATKDEQHNLQRDHRTALMYAAENASPQVIAAILAAGADVSAKDTKGNTAVWYFGRNTRISDATARTHLLRMLGG